jgi:hypothetical protein
MKKLVLGLALLATGIMYGQTVKIDTIVDEMTDKVSYSVNEDILCMAEDGKKGFRVTPHFTAKNGSLHVTNIIITFAGLESCSENNKLIILFEGGDKIQLTSWNKFNCKGTAYFSILPKNKNKLMKLPIDKIRFTNGLSYKSYTHEIEYKNYFVELIGLLK